MKDGGLLGGPVEVPRKPPSQSVAAEHSKGDLTDDPVPGQGFRQDANNKANHCGAAIEQFRTLKALVADLCSGGVLEPVVVGG
jgi:hypothetical protein